MSLLEEEKNEQTTQHPEHTTEETSGGEAQGTIHAHPPSNEYWVNTPPPPRPTTPQGYGQGYPQPTYPPQYPPQNYQGAYPPPQSGYRPTQYQYSANNGWQQPPSRPAENYQWNFEDYDKATSPKTKKKRNRGLVVFVILMVCVLSVGVLSVAGWGVYTYLKGDEFLADSLLSPHEESSETADPAAQLELASKPQISESLPVGGKMTTPQVAKAVLPSVVGVVQYRPDMYLQETGEGSGIIMSSDGYVITNAHVVNGGTAFKVILSDGTPKDAELVGMDTQTDLAVLKINGASGLTPAVFGDSTQIDVGEIALVIGNPGGTTLAGSVTQGIISAVNREIPGSISSGSFTIPLIQTDAAINPGNSGGALVNEYGQVIGIASAKIVAEDFEGICFAIPISEAKPIIDDIVANGRVTGRVKLGITAREIDEIDARNYGLQVGVRIEEILPDSDLLSTDAQRFDIITHIDGQRITDLTSLKKILSGYKPGSRVKLTLFRAMTSTRSDTLEVTVLLLEDK